MERVGGGWEYARLLTPARLAGVSELVGVLRLSRPGSCLSTLTCPLLHTGPLTTVFSICDGSECHWGTWMILEAADKMRCWHVTTRLDTAWPNALQPSEETVTSCEWVGDHWQICIVSPLKTRCLYLHLSHPQVILHLVLVAAISIFASLSTRNKHDKLNNPSFSSGYHHFWTQPAGNPSVLKQNLILKKCTSVLTWHSRRSILVAWKIFVL